jgi:hypothetical protein
LTLNLPQRGRTFSEYPPLRYGYRPANSVPPGCCSEDTGSVYYSEAKQPEDPYGKAVKIIHHDRYNFSNVATHMFLNKEGGRVIYLEGTYMDSFSGTVERTPPYNYNQLMYCLRLDDPRFQAAQE